MCAYILCLGHSWRVNLLSPALDHFPNGYGKASHDIKSHNRHLYHLMVYGQYGMHHLCNIGNTGIYHIEYTCSYHISKLHTILGTSKSNMVFAIHLDIWNLGMKCLFGDALYRRLQGAVCEDLRRFLILVWWWKAKIWIGWQKLNVEYSYSYKRKEKETWWRSDLIL